jgi:L-ascorbate metabolism protein UlaG (beta-lactamase superfamily)
MDPADAVRAHLDLGARVSIGTHFGCFQLTDEAIDDPPRELALAREREGVAPEAFVVLETGETRLFNTVRNAVGVDESKTQSFNSRPTLSGGAAAGAPPP